MEVLELLESVKSKIIDVESALDLLLVYINEKHIKKGQTILTLVSEGKLKTSSAEGMIKKLISDEEKILENLIEKENSSKGRGSKNRRAARPLERDEYEKIISLCKTGFTYSDKYGVPHIFRANKQLGMTFILQATLGLRIADVMKLKPVTFKNDKLEIIEKKTGKLQYRTINKNLKELIYEYAMENNIKSNDYIIKVTVRGVRQPFV